MKLYQILLPVFDNDGAEIWGAHVAWRQYVLNLVGGYTQQGVSSGLWQDRKSNHVHTDELVTYQVATTREMWRLCVAKAFELWPDQKAIMWAELGDATIETRP